MCERIAPGGAVGGEGKGDAESRCRLLTGMMISASAASSLEGCSPASSSLSSPVGSAPAPLSAAAASAANAALASTGDLKLSRAPSPFRDCARLRWCRTCELRLLQMKGRNAPVVCHRSLHLRREFATMRNARVRYLQMPILSFLIPVGSSAA